MNANFFNCKSDPDISPFDSKYFNPNEIREGFECLYKNDFSVLHVSIRSINENFGNLKTPILNLIAHLA